MFKGSRLRELCNAQRGLSTKLSQEIFGKSKGIDRFYHDDINITVRILEQIAVATGKSVEYFLDYPRPTGSDSGHSTVYGDNNIVNSPMANETVEKITNLQNTIKMKDELIQSLRDSITTRDELIRGLKERINDTVTIMQQMGKDKSQT